MTQLSYKYIVIDIDGTLFDDQDHFDLPRFNHNVEKLTSQGVTLIVASGNGYDALQTIFRDCPLVTTFIAENGGRLIVNHQELSSHHHSQTTIQRLLTYLQANVPKPDLLSLSGSHTTHIAEEYRAVPVPFYPHHDYFSQVSEITGPIYNLNINWYQQQLSWQKLQAISTQLNANFPEVTATYSGSYGIDILPAGVNKGQGLKELITDYFHDPLTSVIAFGDSSNDLSMFKVAGTGVAMKNSSPDLLAIADSITSFDNNRDGLLAEIERIFCIKRPLP